jgi:glycosyltransferase involved in cell wall biosynthesis
VDDARSLNAASCRSVLSYFRSYFDPARRARFANHSTGLIARHLYDLLAQFASVEYFGSKERPEGLEADLFIGHFWAFAELCERNRFATKVAFYSVSDPDETRRLLAPLAQRFGVPMPEWDLPPRSFDHARTMELADVVFVVGNTYTLHTFPERWRSKIVLLNYSIDCDVFRKSPEVDARNEFCYVATHCGLRKGFVDVLDVWSRIDPSLSRLHVIGNLAPPFDRMLAEANNGSIVYHGWIDSDSLQYQSIIERCRFAHVPTYSEGQMGTLLELIHSGCVPITTAASGVDDEVLAECLVVEPLDAQGQRAAIDEALSWSSREYAHRRRRLLEATRRRQTWESFDTRVRSALGDHLVSSGARCSAMRCVSSMTS